MPRAAVVQGCVDGARASRLMGRRAGTRCETVALRTSLQAGARRPWHRKVFDELNDLGRDLQLQAQKVELEAQNLEKFKTQLGSLKYFLVKFKIVPTSLPENMRKEGLMYISLKDSCTKGFKKWADAYPPETKNDFRASGGNGVAAAIPDHDHVVMTSPERPHRPWLVPGAGTL
jgi:hypothetical protein